MKKLVIEFSNERLITPSGLSLVGQMLGKSNFIKILPIRWVLRLRRHQIPCGCFLTEKWS